MSINLSVYYLLHCIILLLVEGGCPRTSEGKSGSAILFGRLVSTLSSVFTKIEGFAVLRLLLHFKSLFNVRRKSSAHTAWLKGMSAVRCTHLFSFNSYWECCTKWLLLNPSQ